MDYHLSVLGCGNMAQAILKGAFLDEDGLFESVSVYDVDMDKCEEMQRIYGVDIAESMADLLKSSEYESDVLLLCVKPQIFHQIGSEIRRLLPKDIAIVSIMAGISTQTLERTLGRDQRILRVMPNLPLSVGEGATIFCEQTKCLEHELLLIRQLFRSMGKTFTVPDKLMDAMTALSCTPAFVYMFIEALADGGVRQGIDRKTAQDYAAQVVLGSARMALEGDKHPGALKDAVCSPGGVTIEGVTALEQQAFRGTVMQAIDACAQKAYSMSQRK